MGGSGLLQADADLPVVFVDPRSITYPLSSSSPMTTAAYDVAWRRFDRVPAGQEDDPVAGDTVALNHFRNRQRKLSRERKLVERLAAPDLAPPAPEAGVVDWLEASLRARLALQSGPRIALLVAWMS